MKVSCGEYNFKNALKQASHIESFVVHEKWSANKKINDIAILTLNLDDEKVKKWNWKVQTDSSFQETS